MYTDSLERDSRKGDRFDGAGWKGAGVGGDGGAAAFAGLRLTVFVIFEVGFGSSGGQVPKTGKMRILLGRDVRCGIQPRASGRLDDIHTCKIQSKRKRQVSTR
jgi:hypothetical protein